MSEKRFNPPIFSVNDGKPYSKSLPRSSCSHDQKHGYVTAATGCKTARLPQRKTARSPPVLRPVGRPTDYSWHAGYYVAVLHWNGVYMQEKPYASVSVARKKKQGTQDRENEGKLCN